MLDEGHIKSKASRDDWKLANETFKPYMLANDLPQKESSVFYFKGFLFLEQDLVEFSKTSTVLNNIPTAVRPVFRKRQYR